MTRPEDNPEPSRESMEAAMLAVCAWSRCKPFDPYKDNALCVAIARAIDAALANERGMMAHAISVAVENERLGCEKRVADAVAKSREWTDQDQPLPEDEAILSAHPTVSRNHARYMEALRMVTAKRSKYALVDLVNWLLAERDAAVARDNNATVFADPRDIIKCACPRIDAEDCAEYRSGVYSFDEDDRRRVEHCECACHSLVGLNRKQCRLAQAMSEISEECICATWEIGCEFRIWTMVINRELHYLGPGEWGPELDQEDLDLLKKLSDECGGWIAWRDDDHGVRFVPMAEWLIRYAEEQKRVAAWWAARKQESP